MPGGFHVPNMQCARPKRLLFPQFLRRFKPARLSRSAFRAWANASRPLPTFSAILLANAFYTAIRERAAFPFLHF